jgi:metallo-beta-lactamase family protein
MTTFEERSVPLLTFLGGTGTVTGSKFLIDTPTERILVDCGLYQGAKALRERNREPFPVAPSSIDAVVLTHAHVDHCGYLPRLVKDGFRGPIYATQNTVDLVKIVLPDSGHLQEEEAAYANRKGFSKHHPAQPLYTEEDAYRSLERLHAVAFGAVHDVTSDLQITFQPAGHILGSSIVQVDYRDDHGHTRRVTFSGDLGRPKHPLLRPPTAIGSTDFVVVESTYGGRHHDDVAALDTLASAITRTAKRGGVVVIPAFAVDRTEVLLLHMQTLLTEGRIPDLPIYVDSPMALNALVVYRRAVASGSPEIRPESIDGGDLLDRTAITEVRTVERSMELDQLHGPAVIISASGMATGGRVLHHLNRYLPDHRSTVILVGFQAAQTRGRLLAEGARQLKLLGRYVPVRAEVVDLPSFSVHAEHDELLEWLGTAERPPEAVFIVHGEPEGSRALQTSIADTLGWNAVVPRYGERVRLD